MTSDRLDMVFHNQKELMKVIIPKEDDVDEYIYIPKSFGIENINDRAYQRYIREMGNRFIEELGEALMENDPVKQWEELVDCLHFLTELSIIVDFDPRAYITLDVKESDSLTNLCEWSDTYASHITTKATAVHEIIRNYGRMTNALRSKPWKLHYEETETHMFNFGLMNIWKFFTRLMSISGMKHGNIWAIYQMKNQVNFERQENGY